MTKVAIIMGGGGIGGATARRLAASGVAVVIGDPAYRTRVIA